jgi:hypothetical protein
MITISMKLVRSIIFFFSFALFVASTATAGGPSGGCELATDYPSFAAYTIAECTEMYDYQIEQCAQTGQPLCYELAINI